jgi:hypothetical protein
MKQAKVTFLVLFLTIISVREAWSQFVSRRDLSRGSDTAELFISCFWYNDEFHTWGGIFHSVDNGQTLTMQHKFSFPSEWPEIYGDSAPGKLMIIPAGCPYIGVSQDYGISFEQEAFPTIIEGYPQHTGGSMSGELYIAGNIANHTGLLHLTDFADSCLLVNPAIDSILLFDGGSEPGEIYGMKWFENPVLDTFLLVYSSDFGHHFFTTTFDTSLFYNLYKFSFSRGTEPGEVYLTGFDFNMQWHVFHSTDYGHTFDLRHITPVFWEEYVSFTAGRKPGTFYISKWISCGITPAQHCCLEIYFSRDYGATYTTYYHEIDSTSFTGILNTPSEIKLEVFPNPAESRVQFDYDLPGIKVNSVITIYDLLGNPVRKMELSESEGTVMWDTSNVPDGLYFYIFTSSNNRKDGRFLIKH